MSNIHRISTTFCLVALILGARMLYAQSNSDQYAPAPSYAELVERLEKTDERLAELEKIAKAEALEDQLEDEFGDNLEKGLEDRLREDLDAALEDENFNLEAFKDRFAKQLRATLHDENLFEDTYLHDHHKPTVEVGGRIQLDYLTFPDSSDGIGYFEHPDPDSAAYGTDPENRLLFRRIRIRVQSQINDQMLARIVVDFAEPSEPEIKDLYMGWLLPGNRKLLLGRSKVPLGLDAINSNRLTVFLERPAIVQAFNRGERRVGLRMQGFRDDLTMAWQYGLFGMQKIQLTGENIGDSFQPILYGRVTRTPWYDEASGGRGYLHLGLAGAVGRPDGDASPADSNRNSARFRAYPNAHTSNRWIDTLQIAGASTVEQMGLEGVINVGAIQVVSEYMTTWVQRDGTTPGTGPNTFFHGGYIQATYFLTGDYMPWDREMGEQHRVHPMENFFLVDRCTGGVGSGWGAWQLAARYGYADLTDADIRGGVQDDLTLGLNWYWNAYARMQFNVTRGFIEQHRNVGGFEEGDFWNIGSRFSVDF